MDFSKIIQIINSNDSFLITTHVNPDADAIGSEMGFYYLIRKLNKSAKIINYSKIPYYLEFSDPDNVIEKFDAVSHSKLFDEADVLVALDFQQLSRISEMQDLFRNSSKIKLCIDHHEFPENFTENLFVDPSYASTGEMVFDLISEMKIDFDFQIAESLYAAIMTDTGSFRYDRTTSETHLRIAKLLETGINPNQIYKEIYDQGSLGKLNLLGSSLLSMKFDKSNQIAYMKITKDDLMKTNTSVEDTEGFVNYCLTIKGIKVGLLFFETETGFKASLRSVGKIPVNRIAAEYGGGGHMNAAGLRIDVAKIEDYEEKIIDRISQYLKGMEV